MILRNLLLVSSIILFTTTLFAQSGTIRGIVYDDETGEPMMFTNVFLKGTTIGASTNVDGFYQISKIPTGDYTLSSTNLGYDVIEIPVSIKGDGEIITQKLVLKKSSVDLNTFELSAEAQEAKTQVRMSVTNITVKDIQQIPTVGGEADLAQYLQVLPGVIFTGDQGGQLYIRGGSPIQNKVLLDGMIVYNPFHSIGLFSVFDTDIMRNADVYTGGFNAEYGGRISSIMDITTRDGNKRKMAGKLSLSPFGAKGLIEGPLKKETTVGGAASSFVVSAKTSYLEQSSKLFYTYIDTAGLPFNYTDLYGKMSFSGSNGSKFNVFGFNFRDRVNYLGVSDLGWNTYGAGTNFILIPTTTAVLVEGAFSYSSYNIGLKEGDLPARTSTIDGFNGGLDFTYFLGENEVKYGAEVLGFATNFTFFNDLGKKLEQIENTTEAAGYFKYKWNIGSMVIEPSFRGHYYATLNTFSPEPRIGFKWNISDKIRMKFAGGMYSQNLISANSDRDVVNLFYGFLSGPENLQKEYTLENGNVVERKHELQKANHAITGFEFDLSKRINVNVESYYKRFTQLTNINRNKIYEDIADNADKPEGLRKDFIIEVGDAYGVDFVAKYDYKRLYVWAVYSIGKVTRWDGVLTDENGSLTSYFPIFDRRHNVNFVTSYTFGADLNWEFNARWNLGSGFPFTQTQGFYEEFIFDEGIGSDYTTANGDLGIQYASLNQGRLPYYHRLDVNLKRSFYAGDNSVIEANIGVTNTYNRENIFYFDRVKFERVNQLPFMPSFGINMTF